MILILSTAKTVQKNQLRNHCVHIALKSALESLGEEVSLVKEKHMIHPHTETEEVPRLT